jgi:hypothetical protein
MTTSGYENHCQDSVKCEACPVAKLPYATQQREVGSIIGAVVDDLPNRVTKRASVLEIVKAAEGAADEFGKSSYIGVVVGAVTLTVANRCIIDK